MVRLILTFFLLCPITGFGYHQLDLTWAGSAVKYEGEEQRLGAGARFRYTNTNQSTGVGMSLVLVKEDHRRLLSIFIGGGWRWDGDIFWDFHAGISGASFGISPMIVPAVGFKITNNTYFTIPLFWKVVDDILGRAQIAPYIGFRF